MRDLTSAGGTDGSRRSERLGHASQTRPEGCLLWVHARDGEEAGAAVAVSQELARLRAEPIHLLVTTQENRPLPAWLTVAALHQLAPNETSGSIARFMAHWSPDLALIFGPPDRRNLLEMARKRQVPMFLAYSSRTGRAGVLPAFPEVFDACLAPSTAVAETLEASFGSNAVIEVSGPLSDTVIAMPCNEAERERLTDAFAGRPAWLAMCVGLEEFDAVEAAQRQAFRSAHRLLLIIVPRDESDAEVFERRMVEAGWRVVQYDRDADLDSGAQVIIARGGDSGLWLRLAPITFLGGSLSQDGETTDPFEVAALGSAIISGPHGNGVDARLARLRTADAVLGVSSADELGARVVELLAPDKAAARAQAGWATVTESAYAVEQLAERMDASLDAIEAG